MVCFFFFFSSLPFVELGAWTAFFFLLVFIWDGGWIILFISSCIISLICIVCIPLMGQIMQKLATENTQQKCTYIFDYVFLSIYTGQNKGSKWQGYNKAVFCFKNRCWVASLNEMWSRQKGGEVVGIAVELTRMSNAEQILNIWQYRSENHQ